MAEDTAVTVARALRTLATELSQLADALTAPSDRPVHLERRDTEADDDMDMPVGP